MAKKRWTRNQKLILAGVIVAAISALTGLFMRTKVLEKRQGIDSESLFSRAIQLAQDKGGLQIELEQARKELDKAIGRMPRRSCANYGKPAT